MKRLIIFLFLIAMAVCLWATSFGPATPAVTADDATISYLYSEVTADYKGCAIGNNGGYEVAAFFRFPNATIAKGSTISSAKIQFTADEDRSGTTANLNIYLNNVDNAVAPTTFSGFTGLALTSAVAWNSISAWTYLEAAAAELTPDFSTLVQAVVGRAGWVSGNALMVVIHDNSSSTDARRSAYQRSASNTSYLPALSITYTEPSSSTPHRLLLLGAGN